MHALRTAVIEHTTADGVHHDWLIEDPRLLDPHAAQARLWTARVLPPPRAWARLGRFTCEVIPPHRRIYLQYQGPISGGRGRVRRVTAGTCMPELWRECAIAMCLTIDDEVMRIAMRRINQTIWLAETIRIAMR